MGTLVLMHLVRIGFNSKSNITPVYTTSFWYHLGMLSFQCASCKWTFIIISYLLSKRFSLTASNHYELSCRDAVIIWWENRYFYIAKTRSLRFSNASLPPPITRRYRTNWHGNGKNVSIWWSEFTINMDTIERLKDYEALYCFKYLLFAKCLGVNQWYLIIILIDPLRIILPRIRNISFKLYKCLCRWWDQPW